MSGLSNLTPSISRYLNQSNIRNLEAYGHAQSKAGIHAAQGHFDHF